MLTPNPSLAILYVADSLASAEFYKKLLDREPAAAFPTYAAFAFDNGLMLGLWSKSIAPPPSASGNRSELAFVVEDAAAVEAVYAEWKKKGVPIGQEPVDLVFGRTFVGLDPDGHRLRVCIADK
jgi:predicted enzyme related to lactoylglutathione lyase